MSPSARKMSQPRSLPASHSSRKWRPSMPADLVIRGGTVVTESGADKADIAIESETIQAVGKDLPGAETEINAEGLTIFPGLIDVHLHFNEPGHEDWEGAASGSRALAAGGGTA